MPDIKFIRENPEKVQAAAKSKRADVAIKKILEIDKNYREFDQAVQKLREQVNTLTKSIKGKPSPEQLQEGKKIKCEIKYTIGKCLNCILKVEWSIVAGAVG